MKWRVVLTLVVLWPVPTMAEVPEDVMEVQRCVWRCQAEYGTDDPRYGTCVATRCNGEAALDPVLPPAPELSPLAPGPGVLTGVWTYANHPVLGPSAHLETGAGTLGLGCGIHAAGIGLRLQNSFFVEPAMTWITAPGGSAATLRRMQGDWSGVDGDTCTVPVEALAMSEALYLVPAAIARLQQTEAGVVITLSDGVRTGEVLTGPEALAAFGGYVVPLTGAHAAISALLEACPSARQAVLNGCSD